MSDLQMAYDSGLISCPKTSSLASELKRFEVLFSDGKHPASTTGRVVQGFDNTGLCQLIGCLH